VLLQLAIRGSERGFREMEWMWRCGLYLVVLVTLQKTRLRDKGIEIPVRYPKMIASFVSVS
jgi:hypothetical protein